MAVNVSLFLYGPWQDGGRRFAQIRPYLKSIQDAHILGQAYCNELGYPVVSLDGRDRIQGQFATLQGPAGLSCTLEMMRGPLEFVSTEVFDALGRSLGPGDVVAASTSRIHPAWSVIPNSDWRARMRSERPLPESLTERQATYLKRLGASSGRDIVPINLDLYQELLKLGMVIDKGRRLALSFRGKEVVSHLAAEVAQP